MADSTIAIRPNQRFPLTNVSWLLNTRKGAISKIVSILFNLFAKDYRTIMSERHGTPYFRRNPICRTGLQRILAGRTSDWPPAAFYCPRYFFGERLPNAWRSRARALLAARTGQTVRGRVGVRVGWGLCRYLGQTCAKTSCKNSLQARPANRGSRISGGTAGSWFQNRRFRRRKGGGVFVERL